MSRGIPRPLLDPHQTPTRTPTDIPQIPPRCQPDTTQTFFRHPQTPPRPRPDPSQTPLRPLPDHHQTPSRPLPDSTTPYTLSDTPKTPSRHSQISPKTSVRQSPDTLDPHFGFGLKPIVLQEYGFLPNYWTESHKQYAKLDLLHSPTA